MTAINHSYHFVGQSLAWIWSKFGQVFGDKLYLKVRYYLLTGDKLNLETPQTFNDKLQWLKIYDRQSVYTTMVDKYAVKDYVSSVIGSKYVIPTLGVWDSPYDVEWDILPNQFVLKTTHGGGSNGVVICRDKEAFDHKGAIKKLAKNLKSNWMIGMEWPYKDVPHRIIAEMYISPSNNDRDLVDYKWFCFNGEPLFCQVIQNRSTKETIDFFDTNWKHQPFIGLNPSAGQAPTVPPKPADLDEQIMIAKRLSSGIPFVRVDLYSINNKPFFGEMTFYPMSGFGRFSPVDWNTTIGRMLILPQK